MLKSRNLNTKTKKLKSRSAAKIWIKSAKTLLSLLSFNDYMHQRDVWPIKVKASAEYSKNKNNTNESQ